MSYLGRKLNQVYRKYYGLYKLDRVCKYVAHEAMIARWVKVLVSVMSNYPYLAESYYDAYVQAGGVLMEAKERVRNDI
jgi:hypothetical protein